MGSVWVYVDLESPRGDLWFTIQYIPNLAHLVRVVRVLGTKEEGTLGA